MNQHEYIKKFNELEFAVFCIKNVAKNWGGVNAASVYQAFIEKSDILNGYIVPDMMYCIPRVGNKS